MNEQNEIPAEMLDAAAKGVADLRTQVQIGLCSIRDVAEAALEASGVPALLAERDGLLFVNGELSEAAMEAQAEARQLRARVAEMEADSARLRLLTESGMDGLDDLEAIDYIEAVMRERGHDEWTPDDEFEGWRRLLDEAMAARRGAGGVMSDKQCPHGHPIDESTGMGVVVANYQPTTYVSRDMAIDAGDWSLEGSIYTSESWDYGQCPECAQRRIAA